MLRDAVGMSRRSVCRTAARWVDRAASPKSGAPGPSHIANSGSRSRRATDSANAMNWVVVTLPPACVLPTPGGSGETVVADLDAKRLQGHRTADVDREVEQLDRRRGRRWATPRTRRRAGISRGPVEVLLGGPEALALAPQPFGVGREAFVEPDVLPRVDGEVVAEPLMGELVDDARSRCPSGPRRRRTASRSGASGSRVRTRHDVVDDAARRGERIRPELRRPRRRGSRAGDRTTRAPMPRTGYGRAPRRLASRCSGCPGCRPAAMAAIGPAVEDVAVGFERGRALPGRPTTASTATPRALDGEVAGVA